MEFKFSNTYTYTSYICHTCTYPIVYKYIYMYTHYTHICYWISYWFYSSSDLKLSSMSHVSFLLKYTVGVSMARMYPPGLQRPWPNFCSQLKTGSLSGQDVQLSSWLSPHSHPCSLLPVTTLSPPGGQHHFWGDFWSTNFIKIDLACPPFWQVQKQTR